MKNNTKNQSQTNSNLSIKDCLKLIGFKELTANVFELPKIENTTHLKWQ